jgi:hypothetical protein
MYLFFVLGKFQNEFEGLGENFRSFIEMAQDIMTFDGTTSSQGRAAS